MWVFALWVFPIAGCNEVTAPTTARITLTVTAWDPEAGFEVRLEGVQLCETDSTRNCMTTEADGEATIKLPIGETSYTLRKKGHPSYLVPQVLSANGAEYPFQMGREEYFVDQHQNMMSDYPMIGTGTVQLGLVDPFAGATFDLMGATGRGYYDHERGRDWDPDLSATTSRGLGGFVEVPPGDDFQINLGGTANDCAPDLGWPAEGNSVRFPVRWDHITRVSVSCALPPTKQLLVRTQEAVEGSLAPAGGPLLEGEQVCEIDDASNCATSDTNGEARLTLPREKEISYTVTKDGYAPYLTSVPHHFGWRNAFMVPDAQVEALAEDLGIEYPLTGGIVALQALPREMGGVTFALEDEKAVGYYVDEAGAVRLDLTATTSKGEGGFVEVPTGEHQIDFGGTAIDCFPWHARPGDGANQIKVLVEVGHITFASMSQCDEP